MCHPRAEGRHELLKHKWALRRNGRVANCVRLHDRLAEFDVAFGEEEFAIHKCYVLQTNGTSVVGHFSVPNDDVLHVRAVQTDLQDTAFDNEQTEPTTFRLRRIERFQSSLQLFCPERREESQVGIAGYAWRCWRKSSLPPIAQSFTAVLRIQRENVTL
jgi:hypothetical protein